MGPVELNVGLWGDVWLYWVVLAYGITQQRTRLAVRGVPLLCEGLTTRW